MTKKKSIFSQKSKVVFQLRSIFICRDHLKTRFRKISEPNKLSISFKYECFILSNLTKQKMSLFQYEWDDQEEENYRQWIRQLQDERSTQHEIDWAELDNETAYREKLKRQTAENASMPITWEDEQEKILRERYIDMRYVISLVLIVEVACLKICSELPAIILSGFCYY